MSDLKEAPRNRELEQVVNDLAKWDASDVGNPPSAAEEVTLRELKAELDTLASELREPPPADEFEDESDCRRAVELVERIGREPSFSTQKALGDAQGAESDLGPIGPYQIVGKVGQGGMGTVYKALHTKLEKIVALKVLPSDKLQDEHAVARFEREMKAVGKLEHPNIVRATDAGEIDGKHFLVMEYVDGLDLSTIVRSIGPLSVADACEVVRQTAIGLQHAHEHRLVHRDIKPSNLMLMVEGRRSGVEGGSPQSAVENRQSAIVKVLDMGLALLEERRLADQRDLTTTGQLMGTPAYMAPEQGADSHEVDIRADIYSLGVTLFKLLCGETPFSGEKYRTPMQVLLAIASEPAPAIADRRDDVPAELVAIVDRMLQKNPDQRFATPDEVAAALVPFCDGCDLAALLQKAEEAHRVARERPPSAAPAVHLTSPSAETQGSEESSGKVRQGTPVATASDRPSVSRRRPVLLGVAIGVLAILAASWAIHVATDKGTITIASYDPEIEIAIRRNEEVVDEFHVKQHRESTSYYSGRFEIEIKGGTPDGVEIKNQQFTLKRGDDVLVEIVRTGGAALASDASRATREPPPLAKAPFDAKQAKAHQQAWATYLGVEVEITNSIGMKFRLIPPGEFMMGGRQGGSFEDADFEADEDLARRLRSKHPVRLTRPFYLAVHEVTQEEYEQVMGKTPSHFCSAGDGRDKVAGQSTSRHPVENVTWLDAMDFCKKLSARENRRSCYAKQGGQITVVEGNGYRLPTEAEWEYACRAGSTGRYSFVDESKLGDYAWYGAPTAGTTHPVGQKLANAFGLHDVHGNVQEWCQDWYQDWYGAKDDEKVLTETSVDPLGPTDGLERVYRGGSWFTWSHFCWSARRDDAAPTRWESKIGFRLVSVLEDQGPGAKVEPQAGGTRPLKRGDDVLDEIVRRDDAALAPNASRSTGEAPPLAKAPFDAKQAKAHQQAWATYLGVEVEMTNSIGMKFRLIPPGEFMMGSPRDEDDELALSEEEWLQHRVRLTRPFYLAAYEVTQEEYQQLMGENSSYFSSEGEGKDVVAGQSTDRHPADTVWWQNAIDFCKKISARENRSSCYAIQGGRYTRVAGNGYRLPTEAEWEYACRAGSTGNYSFIDESEADNYAWHHYNSAGMTHPVGEKLANGFGLHDMHGNVREWCQDWYQDWYGAKDHVKLVTETSVDPLGPAEGWEPVNRGGDWQHWAHMSWSARRYKGSLGGTGHTTGFRVVSVLEDDVPGAKVEPTADGAGS